MVKNHNAKDLELEILTIERFIVKEKAGRYSGFVAKEKTRQKFISQLAHLKDLDYTKFKQADPDPKALIFEIAKACNANVCYVISENKEIDGQYINVAEAIEKVIGYGMGSILVFGHAQAVYFEGEEMSDRWVSVVL